jgi:aspartate-semialdehyde dehydrogenase
VPRLLELGYRVVDKSRTYRADPKVPLVVAGVNSGRVDEANASSQTPTVRRFRSRSPCSLCVKNTASKA